MLGRSRDRSNCIVGQYSTNFKSKMASRQKRVTEAEYKERKAAEARRTRQKMVNLRDQIDRWREIADENQCKHDGEVAKLLIDCYYAYKATQKDNQSRNKRKASTPKRRKLSPPHAMVQNNSLDCATSSASILQTGSESYTEISRFQTVGRITQQQYLDNKDETATDNGPDQTEAIANNSSCFQLDLHPLHSDKQYPT